MKFRIDMTVQTENSFTGRDLHQSLQITNIEFPTVCAIVSAVRDLAWMDGGKVDGKEDPK